MKIKDIHIYGFGKFSDMKMTNLHEFQVLFGENEAGKSTIMSFIHSLLFGFPTRLQSEPRYEPKEGAKYGGRMTVDFAEKGIVVIERVIGKASGNVIVMLEDGTKGGEELLRDLLHRVDKTLFQSIFSFNIHGIQNVHRMKGEDLGKYLFSAGALGTDQLIRTENTLQKEMDSRFKPNGKKPYLNEKLKELKHLRNELKKAEQQNEQYWKLQSEKDRLEIDLTETQAELAQLHSLKLKLEAWRQIQPLKLEEVSIIEELNNYMDIPFPIDGLSKLDRLEELMKPLEGQISSHTNRLKILEDEIKNNAPDFNMLGEEQKINSAVESLSLYERLEQEEKELQDRCTQLREEELSLREKLHLTIEDEELFSINTSVFMKEKVKSGQEKYRRLDLKKHELDERFNSEKQLLEEIEDKIKNNEKQLQSETERKALKDKMRRKRVQERTQFIIFSILFSVLIAWGILESKLPMILLGAFGIIFSIYLFNKKSANADNVFGRDKNLLEQLTHFKIQWTERNAQYERVLMDYETWENEMVKAEREIIELGEGLLLPGEIALAYLSEAFELIEQLKKLYREKKKAIDRQHLVTGKKNDIVEAIEHLSNEFLGMSYSSIQERAYTLRNRLKEEMEKNLAHEGRKAKLIELKEERQKYQLQWDHFNRSKGELYQQAFVSDEKSFREAGKMDERKRMLEEQLLHLQRQLKIATLNEQEMELFQEIADLDERLYSYATQHKMLEEKIPLLQSDMAKVKYEIQLLEEGGTHAELLHLYKQKHSELDMGAREWVKFAAAKDMLNHTIERFKNERLPRMLEKAEEYLEYLTDGKYIKIFPKQEGSGFLLQRKDQQLFEANELSQATAEQVYVSLRLALAVTIYGKFPFPIIIDDSFVNFDQHRTRKVIHLLKRLKGRQVLFFTCHQHLLTYFLDDQVVEVGKEMRTPLN
ncbi:AAA family ATPase [Bacillus sp. DTU_2020_1000418_1_SI_GHA_SEK_038]|uniref:ATP-binding protein n=1 Tax=Bacillus sp. DTU_2020_1000418_1_SI_GHA_SEK_038 TaxID=3077585 RepID=UPI0028ED4CA2|nr:AAA family ATPase [Bacillus sp. DTU_2020_1000418_1_SI_GHA_SEK_038]WNS76757.1 AAA family ATPase [Bacillus sp. DTU_2020_1000418_1_SI_GHA_SEK_038]